MNRIRKQVDLNELRKEMEVYLSSKGVKINIEEALGKYNFILMNKYKDHWFWTFDLVAPYTAEEISLELFKYFKGVKTISSIVSLASIYIGLDY